MRAILLQKDKYGETGDRLHGRYGLTGKPTLTQTSIAGSLGTSFKAGQSVTLNSLRSLNEKLKEAQNAITGSKQNIEKAGSTIEETEKLGNEAVQILSENLWNKLWDQKISIQNFVAAKFFEDQQNELMVGEPNYPVASIPNTLDTAPLPRVCYWDPWFKIQNVKIDSSLSDDDLAFLNESYAETLMKSVTLQEMTKIMRNVKQAMIVLNTASYLLEGMLVFASSTGSGFAAGALVTLLFKIAVYLIIMKLIDWILTELMEAKVTGLEGTKGRGALFYATAPNQFHFQNWVTKVYFEPGLSTIYNAINIACMTIQGVYITAGTLISAGTLIAMSPIPWIKVIGEVMRNAGIATAKYTGFAAEAGMISNVMTVLGYALAGSTSRTSMADPDTLFNIGESLLPSEIYRDTYEDVVGKDLTNGSVAVGLVNLPGSLNGFKNTSDLYDIPGISTASMILTVISNVFATVGYKIFEVFAKSLWVFGAANNRFEPGYDLPRSQVTLADRNLGGNSEDSVIHCDTFGLDTPKLQWNYNLPNVKKINAGSWVWGPLKWELQKDSVKHTSTIKSYSFVGRATVRDKSKYVSGKAYIDLIQKTTYDNWMYYGFLRLEIADINDLKSKLTLVYERNALYYTGKYKVGSGQLLHAEQVIYNFDFRHDFKWPKKVFTSDRRGRLNYYYCDFADGVRLQYRPVTKAKDNILDGDLINTEYEFDDFVYLRQLPLHGTVEGSLDSYVGSLAVTG